METCAGKLHIPCKEDLRSLELRCSARGITINPASLRPYAPHRPNKDRNYFKKTKYGSSKPKVKTTYKKQAAEYEVEKILDLKIEDDAEYYFVQWKGWGEEFNTWEPGNNIINCPKLLEDFYLRSSINGLLSKKLRILDEKYMKKLRHMQLVDCATKAKNCLTAKSAAVTSIDHESLLPTDKRKSSSGKSYLEIVCQVRRNAVYHQLKEWERTINAVAPDEPPIVVENTADFEGPPDNFTYIKDYQEGEGVVIPRDPLVGCSCTDCLSSRDSCCAHGAGSQFAYSRYRRLILPPGSAIFECNKCCSCDETCHNRVVQFGRKVRLSIFRTTDGRGWGVKTLQKISKNMFVMEYLGEVITNDEAERRGQQYDAEGRTYLFDLDFNDDDNQFTVDAARYGNVAHFMNHSCDPNLAVYAVFINTLHLGLPRLAFFTRRDIERGEELTFDYKMNGVNLNRSLAEPQNDDNDLSIDASDVKLDETAETLKPADVRSDEVDVCGAHAGADVTVEGNGVEQDLSLIKPHSGNIKISSADVNLEASDQAKDKLKRRLESDAKRTPCKCGAKNCRLFLY